jgi:hypothetical protein
MTFFPAFEKPSASVHMATLIKKILISQYSTWMQIPVKVIRCVKVQMPAWGA